MKVGCGSHADSKLCVFLSMRASEVLAALIAVLMLTTIGRAKDKVLVIDYQAYSGPALPQDQVSTLDSNVEITLDGHDLHYDWATGRSLREDCKPQKKPHPVTHQPFRCRRSRLLIRVLPGPHTIGVILFAGGTIQFSGPDCTSSSCHFSKDIVVEAGKTYDVDFQGPMGFVSQTATPMFGAGIRVVERRAEK